MHDMLHVLGWGGVKGAKQHNNKHYSFLYPGPKKNDWGKMRTAEVEVAVTEAAEGVAPTRSELKRGGTAGLAEIDEALRSLAHRRLRMRQSCSYWLHAPPLARFRACDAGM